MSEDVDLTIPGEPTNYRSINSPQVNAVAQSLRAIGEEAGAILLNFDGQRSDKNAHVIWEVRYDSAFLEPGSSVIAVEAAIRPQFLAPRKVCLRQLIPPPRLDGYEDAYTWALDFTEVRAEKVRAAFTRDKPEIRDFYDLGLLAAANADMASKDFRDLVDRKLAEIGAKPLADQPKSFGLTRERLKTMREGLKLLESVVRFDEAPFVLQTVLDHYDKLWNK